MLSLTQINIADEKNATELLGPLIERAPEIAAVVAKMRPFEDTQALSQAIRHALFELDAQERIKLYCAHPELAAKNPHAMTSASQTEQGRLSLTSESNDHISQITDLNRRYKAKFGYPFITALARHPDIQSVLAEFKASLASDPVAEDERTIGQIAAVSAERVRLAFAPPPTQGNAESPAIFSMAMPEATIAATTGAMEATKAQTLKWGGEIGGLILALTSLFFIVGGWQLGLGSPFRLGTGAFPFFSGLLLLLLSIGICVQEWRVDSETQTPDWVSFAAIGSGIAVFAAVADRLGLVPAVFLAIVVASAPDKSISWPSKLMLGVGVGIGVWVLFIMLLNLPLNAFAGF